MKGNLLIVDDEPLLIESLKYILKNVADSIHIANNGREGLEVLSSETIHCILCDINMPVMNGVEFLKQIRSENKSIPFIFYTGHGNRELMIEAVRYGAMDFINKPYLNGLDKAVEKGLAFGTQNLKEYSSENETFCEYQKILSAEKRRIS